ncbi:hypothetical protein JO972_01890 [Verrucomicrobiaceae bacterium 5K15]|uniref:Uncharacterized protein n=1 Tax=Oceaniferula flava TaxID=2800421 RepID=A0AAE2SB18_9BACT|nr:hypothetical protein [Oceaniferula flavus]MBK1853697.1 hypothetical protein [Oceaniferula flavus]MBM1135003.1 hypothetical protein [Oceaniferula flavus]
MSEKTITGDDGVARTCMEWISFLFMKMTALRGGEDNDQLTILKRDFHLHDRLGSDPETLGRIANDYVIASKRTKGEYLPSAMERLSKSPSDGKIFETRHRFILFGAALVKFQREKRSLPDTRVELADYMVESYDLKKRPTRKDISEALVYFSLSEVIRKYYKGK